MCFGHTTAPLSCGYLILHSVAHLTALAHSPEFLFLALKPVLASLGYGVCKFSGFYKIYVLESHGGQVIHSSDPLANRDAQCYRFPFMDVFVLRY